MTLRDFGQRSFVTWTEEDLRTERREDEEESVFSDKEDWYWRMTEDQRKGYADYQ